jgi:hypothetical protein
VHRRFDKRPSRSSPQGNKVTATSVHTDLQGLLVPTQGGEISFKVCRKLVN